jgi:uncharacterized protein YndB with AHSA1/START domain
MRLIGILFAATLVLSSPAAAEIATKSETGFVSSNAVEVRASPQEVWRALIAPAGWWNSEHTYSGDAANMWIDAQATGCFCEKLPLPNDAPAGQRPGSVEHMHVIYADPGKLLRLSGGLGPLQSEAVKGTLTITLTPGEGGTTRILWEYVVGGYMRYKTDEIAPAVDTVVAEQLNRLAAKLAAGAAPTK